MSFAALVAGCGGSSATSATSGVKGASEVAAAPISSTGANPFMPKVGSDAKGVKPPSAARGSGSGPVSYGGGLPGLYGGTRNISSCNATQLVNFLEQNQRKASAWATALGIQSTQIRRYVSSLTDVILRTDTRVTNHGYEGGIAIPIQSVLQAGTAVFVDPYGQPVVKCYCGNPLTPPVLYTTPVYTGPLWASFSTTNITIIKQSITVINVFKLYDPNTGQIFTRTPGANGHDGPYLGAPSSPGSPTSTTATATGTASTPSQTSSGGAPSENPSVSLSPNPVTQGDTVTLSASGFAPGASLDITVNRPDGVTEHYPLTAGGDGSGTYTFSNAGGNAPLGTYGVTVTNPGTGASASGSITVVAPATTPTQTLTSTSTTS
jgi:hypothetical protein